jgi:hypothetical protein
MTAKVYVMGSDLGLTKVGMSRRPENRVRIIAAASGVAVRLQHATDDHVDASLIEAAAHRLLDAKRRAGEWFDVSVEEAISAVESAVALIEEQRAEGLLPERRSYSCAFTMRVSTRFLEDLDDLRADVRPLVSRSDYLRRLVEAKKAERDVDAKRSARR